jgi:nucleoside-diphosphate-sugar epimerase
MYRNNKYNNNITIYAICRNKDKALERFKEHINSPLFIIVNQDIQTSLNINSSIDYIIHGASNTHPIAYSTEPINTILTSVLGTNTILNLAYTKKVKRTVFLSTVEIYGENRGDVEAYKEDYCGYIDCNTLRAGYSEGKRTAEALCQAYIKEYNIDAVIARCCRVYGPTMADNDSKVISQFIRNTIKKENITLKSKGSQLYSFCYVADVCSAILYLLLYSKNGEAYNISDNDNNLSLLQIANILSDYSGKSIIYDTPPLDEALGYSKATKAILDNSKLKELGWEPKYSIKDGIIRTVEILRNG